MPRTDYSISPYGQARCPVCRGDFSLTKGGVLRAHGGGLHPRCAGAGEAPAATPATVEAPAAPANPQSSIADRRRRLEADAADAKKALAKAQHVFDNICDELAALRREEMETLDEDR